MSEFENNLLKTISQLFSCLVTAIPEETQVYMLNSPAWTHKIFLFQMKQFTEKKIKIIEWVSSETFSFFFFYTFHLEIMV